MWLVFSILSMLAYAATDLPGKRKVDAGSHWAPVELLVSCGVLACGTGLLPFVCGFGESGQAPWANTFTFSRGRTGRMRRTIKASSPA